MVVAFTKCKKPKKEKMIENVKDVSVVPSIQLNTITINCIRFAFDAVVM